MSKYICKVCGYVFDGDLESLPEGWKCPMCQVGKELFNAVKAAKREETPYLDMDEDNVAICRDATKCVKCGNCKSVCRFKQGVFGHYNIQKCLPKTICVECGQCSIACPTGAISIKRDYKKLADEMKDKSKVFVFQTAPSVRVSLAEEFGQDEGTICTGKLVGALRKLGANFVFDTTFGADLTIMEEASELIERIKSGKNLPLMTSCCPAWVKFVEIFAPEKLNLLSTCKSPISMQGEIIKSYWAKQKGIAREKIVSVAITPCTAKKAEVKELSTADYVLPVRELAMWMREKKIDFASLKEAKFDSIMGQGSGSGVIFGNSGGVMEAALRTAYFMLNGRNPEKLEFKEVRNLKGFVECEVDLGVKKLRVASVSGLVNARKLFKKMEQGAAYDFVEVMACLGGCIAGGGQPKSLFMAYEDVRKVRSKALYSLDKNSSVRFSHENPEIKEVYSSFIAENNNKILHRTYKDKSGILG